MEMEAQKTLKDAKRIEGMRIIRLSPPEKRRKNIHQTVPDTVYFYRTDLIAGARNAQRSEGWRTLKFEDLIYWLKFEDNIN